MDYFEHHYALVNDLSPEGRRKTWFDHRYLYDRFLPTGPDARILDFGCGSGTLLEWLRDDRAYTQAFGVDVSSRQVEFARSLGLSVQQSDHPAAWIGSQRPFDVVFMVDVLEHLTVADADESLSAINRALHPGGRLILRVPNANSAFASRYRYIDATHQRSYTEISLRSHLLAAGYTDIVIRQDDVWAFRSVPGAFRTVLKAVSRWLRRISAVGEFGPEGLRVPLSLNILATARKPTL